MNKRIKILQSNIQSVRRTEKREELTFLLNQDQIEIACLQEIWLKPKENFRIKGYNFAGKRREEGYGGVGILLREDVEYEEVRMRSFHPLEVIGVKITNMQFPLLVFSVYAPPDTNLTKELEKNLVEFLEMVDRRQEEVIIAGDFNAHHPIWDDTRQACCKGKAIASAFENSRLAVLNDGAMTTIPRVDARPSAIDITLVSRKVAEKSVWIVQEHTFGGPHMTIAIEIQMGMPIAEVTVKKVNVDKAIEELNNIQPQYMYDVDEMQTIFEEAM